MRTSYPFSVILADFDPGTLTAFYIMLLTVGLVLFCLFISGLLFCMKNRRIAGRVLTVAGICFAVGLIAAVVIIWLSQKGIIHLL
jgi:glucan phosphoethanolaminetransferase (alkaline phosphatase superfamily)